MRYCPCRSSPCRCEQGFEEFLRSRTQRQLRVLESRRRALLDALAIYAERERREADLSVN